MPRFHCPARPFALLLALLATAACGPPTRDEPPEEACGNRRVEANETCDRGIASGTGACPTACDDGVACTVDVLAGSAASCTAACVHAAPPTLACGHGDGCCASGCSSLDDDDCEATCGNGVVEAGEACDANCPTRCDDAASCTRDTLTGSAADCSARCVFESIVACAPGDSCCPAGCTNGSDADCSATCGNGTLEAQESCDPAIASGAGACPIACDDENVCTGNELTGSAASCTAKCVHPVITTCGSGDGCCVAGCSFAEDHDCGASCGNGVVEGDETCDGNCPATCSDGDACTTDVLSGVVVQCSAKCTFTAVTRCVSGDGCCAAGCTNAEDADCAGGRPPGDLCGAPVVVSAEGTLSGQTLIGYADDLQAGTDCARAAAADRFYAVTIPSGKRLVATAVPAADFDVALNLLAGACSGPTPACARGSDPGIAGDPESLTYTNPSSAATTVLLWVDAFGPSFVRSGTFALTIAFETPLSGDTCSAPTPILQSGTLPAQSLAGLRDDYEGGAGCPLEFAAPDRLYSVTVAAGKQLRAEVLPSSLLDVGVAVVVGSAAACESDSRVCEGLSDDAANGGAEVARYANRGTLPETVFLWIEGNTGAAAGTFDLIVSFPDVPAGDTCPTALPISEGVRSGETLSDFHDDYGASLTCPGERTPERVYSVLVPVGKRITATVDAGAMFTPRLTLSGGPAASCASGPTFCAQDERAGAPDAAAETVRWTNPSGSAQTVFLRVEGAATTVFDLQVSLDAPPLGETCAPATPLAIPSVVNATTVGATDDLSGSNSSCEGLSGADRVYALTIGAGQNLRAVLDPEAAFDASLHLVVGSAAACDGSPRVCAANSDFSGDGNVDALTYRNTGSSPMAAWLWVDAFGDADAGAYTLDVSFGEAPGDVCGTAVPIANAGTLANQTLALHANDLVAGSGCSSSSGVERFYATTIPPGQRLSATATGSGEISPTVSLVAATTGACPASPSCLGSNRGGTSVTASAFNGSAVPLPIWIVIDAGSTGVGGTFTLTTALSLPLPGESCANALTLPLPAQLTGETTTGFAFDYDAACVTLGTRGPDRAYAVAVPAGQKLTATVTPTVADLDLALFIVDGAAAACEVKPLECAEGADVQADGKPETVTWTNTGQTRSVFLVVAGYLSSDAGAFDLVASVGPP